MTPLHDELKRWYKNYGEKTAIQYRKLDALQKLSYKCFLDIVFKLEKDLRADDSQRIAIIGENSALWFIYFYAALLAGKQTFICDMLLPDNEMHEVLNMMKIEKVYLSAELKGLEETLSIDDRKLSFEFWNDELLNYKADESVDICVQKNDSEEGAVICLTSGTTSKAKGVVIGTTAFVNNNNCLSKVICSEIKNIVYSPLPMHHMYGVNKTFAYLNLGSTLCLGSMRSIEKDLQIFKPGIILVVPTVVEFLEKRNLFYTELKNIIVSGCKCENKIQDICDKHGVFLQNIYGSSESAGGMALNVKGTPIDELTVIPGRTVEIADDGEILVKTLWLMDCYYENPEATKLKKSDNVLFTEDIGFIDDNGFLHIKGRKKDMIAMENGDKIYCEETDEMLSALKGVKEAAVIYVNKRLIAVIIPETGASEIDIFNTIEEYNKNQQIIRRIADVWVRQKSLPRTTTGKMKRNELMREYCMSDLSPL